MTVYFIKFYSVEGCSFCGAPNGAKYTAAALDPLLTELAARGYQMVPVSRLIYRENYYIDATGMQVSEQQVSE